jgi:hypothetical protein
MRIDVHIERLVLDGLPVTTAEGPHIRAALEGELARLLASGDVSRQFATGGALPRIDSPQIGLTPRQPPDAIGRAVARSVHAGIAVARTPKE